MTRTYETLVVERRGRAACVTLNLPDRRNPLTVEMVGDLRRALSDAVADGALCIVITGAGKGFCAGGDVTSMAAGFGGVRGDGDRRRDGASLARDGVLTYYRACLAVADTPVPTIAAINGAAVGAGLNLALACDIRYAAAGVRLAASFLRVGLPPGMGSAWLLTRAVGAARAAELVYTAEPIVAEEAERIGLVNRVLPPESLLDEAWAVAAKIASGPPLQLRMAKEALRLALHHDHETVLQFEAMAQAASAETEDLAEGLAAFLEKRPPQFHGR